VSAVDVSIRIEARPDTVFRYFVDPERMCAWMGVTAELDPRPGGRFRINVTGGDIAVGEYVEIVPPQRVVWSWGWEGSDGKPPWSSVVEVTLTPEGEATVVRLRHSGLPDEDARSNHRAGWTHYTSRLAVAAVGGDPGPDSFANPDADPAASSETGAAPQP
jgi:uncharacterized protein YndB with AHSA1/START domain